MNKKISSKLTIIYKFIFTILWIGGFGAGALIGLVNEEKDKWQFLILWFLGSFFLWWFCARLKKVEIENDYLIISNYFRTIKVPISEIENISENIFINPHHIWIRFKNPTEFGRKIIFMPTIVSIFSAHPIVKELKHLSEGKSG